MDPIDKKTLTRSYVKLVSELKVTPVLDYMLSKEILSAEIYEAVKVISPRQEAVRKFLTYLPRCGDDAFIGFIDALRYSRQVNILIFLYDENCNLRKAAHLPLLSPFNDNLSEWENTSDEETVAVAEQCIGGYEEVDHNPISDNTPSYPNVKPHQPRTHKLSTVGNLDEKDVYPIKKPKGLVLIINNIYFGPRYLPREGSDTDVINLRNIFQHLGYNVLEPKGELTADEIFQELVSFRSRLEHEESSACIVVLMTHGEANVLLGVDEFPVQLEILYDLFTARNCPALRGKPKLFIIQACRGEEREEKERFRSSRDADSTDGISDYPVDSIGMLGISDEFLNMVDEVEEEAIPDRSDYLFAYSTSPGHVAWRDSVTGSWYVNVFCKLVREHWEHMHVLDILTKLNNEINRDKSHYVQMPQPVTTLRKFFFL